MVVPAIPSELLTHQIIIKTYERRDGEKFYKGNKTINNVRFQLDHKTNFIDGAVVRTMENLLFVDVQKSTPFDVEDYKIESVIIFEGKEYTVINVEYIQGIKDLHHLEITLV